MPEYAARVLRYALLYGPEPLTLAQLEAADAQAQRHVAMLPARLDVDAARLDTTLHMLRHRLAARIAQRHAQAAHEARMQAALDQEPLTTRMAQDSLQASEMTDQERALTLLRAALVLIMGPQDPGHDGGGRPARLVPPRPTRPSPGTTLDPRRPNAGNLPPKDGIQF